MAQPITKIQLVRGEKTAVIQTNDRSKIVLLNNLGFEAGEEDEDGDQYFEVGVEFISIRRPKDTSGRAEMTDEQKAVTKARLVLARAAKDSKWATNNKELVAKWAESHPEVLAKYFPEYVNGTAKKAKVTTKTKATAKAKVPDPAPEPEEEEVEEEEAEEEPTPAPTAKKGSLAGRLKVNR